MKNKDDKRNRQRLFFDDLIRKAVSRKAAGFYYDYNKAKDIDWYKFFYNLCMPENLKQGKVYVIGDKNPYE